VARAINYPWKMISVQRESEIAVDKFSERQDLPSEQERLPGDLGGMGLDSEALARLLEEVRNDTSFTPAAYNRTYNRHNR
jgi:hypothetical protein